MRHPLASSQFFPAYYPVTGQRLEQDVDALQLQREAVRKRPGKSGGGRESKDNSVPSKPVVNKEDAGSPATSNAIVETPEADKLAGTNTAQASGRTRRKRR